MYHSTTIFNQILAFVPKDRLQRFVGQHQADRYVKKLTVWNQLVVLMYAQATGKDSLREIETGLKTHEHLWYHLGVQSVAKSSVARANNNRTDIPELVNVTTGRVNDLSAAQKLRLPIPRGSFLVFDRGYLDFEWWNTLYTQGMFFVTRPKKPTLVVVSGKHAEPRERIRADERGWIGDLVEAHYPREIRRVRYLNEDGETYEYITNNFELSGEEIALIYRERWRIELFFKWIKQNLKIKSFLGTSRNAVMSQVWVAMIYYLILSYVKFQTKFDRSLLELTRMVRETLFTRRAIIDLLSLSSRTVYKFKVPETFQLRLTGV